MTKRSRIRGYCTGTLLLLSGLVLLLAVTDALGLGLAPLLLWGSVVLLVCAFVLGMVLGVVPRYRRRLFIAPLVAGLGLAGFLTCFSLDYPAEHSAARSGNLPELIETLEIEKHGPDCVNVDGNSLLMDAADSNQPAIIAELLRRGARTTYRNSNGETALSRAERKGNHACVRLLCTAEAKQKREPLAGLWR